MRSHLQLRQLAGAQEDAAAPQLPALELGGKQDAARHVRQLHLGSGWGRGEEIRRVLLPAPGVTAVESQHNAASEWAQPPSQRQQPASRPHTPHLRLRQRKPIDEAGGRERQRQAAVAATARAGGPLPHICGRLWQQQGVALGKGAEGLAGGEACGWEECTKRGAVSMLGAAVLI